VTTTDARRYLQDRHALRRELIRLPSGQLYGGVEEDWQRHHIWEPLDARDANGNPVIHLAYFELARGMSKTTMSAIEALTSALVEDHLEILFFSGDADQASIALTMMTHMINANPRLRSSFNVLKDRILVPATGTTIRVMASDSYTAFGLGGTAKGILAILDEFWVWTGTSGEMLWEAVISSTGKVGSNWRVLVFSNAGIDGESKVAWRIREQCRLEQDPGFYFWRSEGCTAAWVTEEWKAQQRKLLTPTGYTRLIDNVWSAGETQFLDPELWDACVNHDVVPLSPTKGKPLVVGVDAAVKSDAAAVVALYHVVSVHK